MELLQKRETEQVKVNYKKALNDDDGEKVKSPRKKNQGNHTCGICGEKLSLARHLRRHILIVHTLERNHVCEFCQKLGLIRAHWRDIDKKVHSACNDCGMVFQCKKELQEHEQEIHKPAVDKTAERFCTL